MPHKSTQVAVGGLSAALCVVLMMLSAMLPFSTYALPTLAGIALIPAAIELGQKTAGIIYVAASLLSIMLVPDLETALMFVAFFGYYPILKFRIDGIRSRLIRILCKFSLFNAAILLAYQVMIRLFGMVELTEEFGGTALILGMLAVANVAF
ncbi:MAG: hypothetical protein RR197_04640, partial [Oscillospiraceae bacterium]